MRITTPGIIATPPFSPLAPIPTVPAVPATANPETDAQWYQVVDTDGAGVNLRMEPDTGAAKVSVVPEGMRVIGLAMPARNATGDTWVHVRYGDKEGYVRVAFLQPVPAP